MRQVTRGKVAALLAAGASALAVPAAAGAVTFPSGGSTFDADHEGWTSNVTTNCLLGVQCTIGAAHTGAEGNPPGSLQSSYTALLAALGILGNAETVWTSPDFTYTGGPPSEVTFSLDRRADIAALLAVEGSSVTQATLVDKTDLSEDEIFSPAPSDASEPFQSLSRGLPASLIEPGHTYAIEITTTFSSPVAAVLTAQEVQYDNVALEVTEGGDDGNGGDGSGSGGDGSGSGGDGGAGASGSGASGASGSPAGAPNSGDPVCGEVPERRTSRKGRIVYSKQALKIQQNIDSAVIRRLNAVNAWIDAGILPTDLCAGAFGPNVFQAGMTFAGGGPYSPTPPAPRPISIVNKNTNPNPITKSRRQLVINENISRALRARAEATNKRVKSLTGGNLASGATLAGREVWPGLTASGPKPPPAETPPTPLQIGKLPPKIQIVENASTVRKQQRRSQDSIRLANEALDAIRRGLTEEHFVAHSIGSNRL